MQIKYIAEDGKEFDDEYACRDYEEELWLKQCNPETDILFFDDEFNRIYVRDMKSLQDAFDHCWFVCVKTEIARDKVNTLCREFGCEEIPAVGICYKYVEGSRGNGKRQDCLHELMHERDEINTRIDMLTAFMEGRLW